MFTKNGERCGDLLQEELLRYSKDDTQVVITEYMLVASVIEVENCSEGYRWVHIQIKGTNESLANQIEIEQAVKHLKIK